MIDLNLLISDSWINNSIEKKMKGSENMELIR